MDTIPASTIPEYPMARASGCPFDPPPALGTLAPVSRVRLWDGSTPWLITRHADSRSIFADPRVSADARRAGYPHISAGALARRTQAPSFIGMDDPQGNHVMINIGNILVIKELDD